MAKWIRNQYDKALTYENLMNAHKMSKKGKGLRREVILFSLKEEEYIGYLYEKLKTGTYIPYYVPSFIKTTYACIKGRRNASSYFRFTKSNEKNEKII